MPNPALTKLLTDLRASGTVSTMWLFTNAYLNHARRVIKLLGIDHLFDGVTYCDYEEGARNGVLVCKPEKAMFEKAMKDAGVNDPSRCYFVDDSALNCSAATEFGWVKTAHLVEPGDPEPEFSPSKYQIRDILELRVVFPELFEGSHDVEPVIELDPQKS